MATVHLYQDTRSIRKDGKAPIKLVIKHKSKSVLMSTDVYLLPDEWDSKAQTAWGTGRKIANATLSRKTEEVETELLKLERTGQLESMTAQQVKDSILGKAKADAVTFLGCYIAFRDRHTNRRTREIYDSTLLWLRRYDPKLHKLRFEDISKDWLESFNVFLSEGGQRVNSIGIHFRNIRAVFNDAIDNDLTTAYPFRKFKIKRETTRKRNLSVEELARVFNTSFVGPDNQPSRNRYIDTFKLIFYLVGINIGDLCLLKPEDYHNGRITYNRLKTRRFYDIKVEPEAAEIIERYRGKEHLLKFADTSNYKYFMWRMNKTLNEIHPQMSTYWARHSWATIAASLDIPRDTIAHALGHGKSTVTDVYIDFDMRKVDEANRKVIDFVSNAVCTTK